MATLGQLPDDVLVAVMQYLDVDDLLVCRLVCKRLGALALHRDVWRHQRLTYDKPCVCAVMRLAPCLDSVEFNRKTHFSELSTTSCSVRELELDLVFEELLCTQGALVLRNQLALGRLRRVVLTILRSEEATPTQAPFVDTLLKILLKSSHLESLDIPCCLERPYLLRPALPAPCKSSLKYFRCQLDEQSGALVKTVLDGHAATLEEVDLICYDHGYSDKFFESVTGGLLAGIPKLRRLKCSAFLGMEAVAACKMLRDLGITTDDETTRKTVNEGAAVLLRQADHIRTLSIHIWANHDGDADLLDDLLQALTFSGRHLLQRLNINCMSTDCVEPLLRALPRLPTLRELELTDTELGEAMSKKLLCGITPDTAPALRRLELGWGDTISVDTPCTHAWLHADEVRTFLSVNPSIHIHVKELYACYDNDCKACTVDCHQQVEWDDRVALGLFSHGPEDCPSPEDHTVGSKWTWIRVRGGAA